ncbi:response regulator transcription factor [Sporomusa acidovorans]|uniref:Transcriptional regulatory protein WalR n=2 Tax=Sporomusa TaxID=2375 RepID=A0ABZ3J4J3_SPOA4|nr:response regulator transcription factor [Sporomusa acidovorans]OZC16365.1 transcriptional regulatory protein YycF [Sporomusa acidovorans DSM 3132]SDF00793.1 two-component system, OmpR family, KDP operon response regulator KdpE [Sporomusa acidovorans]
MKKSKIFIVDDEPKILRFISANLKSLGYDPYSFQNSLEALEKIDLLDPELILLDIMMPEMDGFAFLKRLRTFSDVPVIILTARGNSSDKVQGLNMGADDYLTKPFSLEELFARVQAVLRRSANRLVNNYTTSEIKNGEVTINLAQRRIWIGNKELKLTETEYGLFSLLMVNAGKVLTHEQLLSDVWGSEYRDDVEYLRVAIARIRQKIKHVDYEGGVIVTYPGVGYMIANKEAEKHQL